MVHAFVISRVDYCLGLLAGAPKKVTDKLQLVLNAAAWVMSNSSKYDHGLAHFQRHVLHWLDVADRIWFRLCVQVFKCHHSMAPGYLAKLCRPVSSIDGHRHLRSARRDVPWVRLSTYGGCAFCHAGPSAWNALPVCLKNNALSLSNFRHQLWHFYFLSY